MSGFSDETPFYVYARCHKDDEDDASFVITTEQMMMESENDPDYYWFWIGVINSVTKTGDEKDWYRSFSCSYGFTEISGQFITTGVIKDSTGGSYWDMENGEFKLQYYQVDASGNVTYFPGIEFTYERNDLGNVTQSLLNVYGTINAYSGTLGLIGMDMSHLYTTSGSYGSIMYLKDKKWHSLPFVEEGKSKDITIPLYVRKINSDGTTYYEKTGEKTITWTGENSYFSDVDSYID